MLPGIHNAIIRDNILENRLIEVTPSVRRIIDTPEFQRLRHIRQMGLSSFVFPTAEHSRFTHSIGVYATSKTIFDHLRRRAVPLDLKTPGMRFDEFEEHEFCIAALCHDIGHSAFSHVLETVLLPEDFKSHEECSIAILSAGKMVGKTIQAVADLEAVNFLLEGKHSNKALNNLISSTFDVDRCDYVLRDSAMSGVEYGRFDFKWLMHAITVETNQLGQPVLVLDGPRGIDALSQFFAARKYLHRQVYNHVTIRGAQILLKGIFSRIQDLGPDCGSEELAPRCLHAIIKRRKLSLGEFINTTDIEIHYMIRSFADSPHPDTVLSYLCKLFLNRNFPKAAVDSVKEPVSLEKRFNIEDRDEAGLIGDQAQGYLLEDRKSSLIEITETLREFISERLERGGHPKEAATYLVALDPVGFKNIPPTDFSFDFRDRKTSIEAVDFASAVARVDNFSIKRIFVPRDFVAEAREYVERKYALTRK